VPFDRAVLEVSGRVAVVPTTTEWSDVGSLLSIEGLAQPDERGNVLVGRVTDVDSFGVVAYSADRLLATLGLRDVMVVDTPDATLVADKGRAQDVRLIVEALKATGAAELVEPRTRSGPGELEDAHQGRSLPGQDDMRAAGKAVVAAAPFPPL